MITVNNVPPYHLLTFPGGEVRIQLDLPRIEETLADITTRPVVLNIKAKIKTPLHLIALLHTVEILQHYYGKCVPIEVYMPYLPYARQDRRCNAGEINGIQYIINALDNAGVTRLTVLDVHNQESFYSCKTNTMAIHDVNIDDTILENIPLIGNYNFIISPDEGARNKIVRIVDKVNMLFNGGQDNKINSMMQEMYSIKPLFFEKKRDLMRGRIIDLSITKESKELLYDLGDKVNEKKFLVIDDICDGGATFNNIAAHLKGLFTINNKPDLFVTHGIFSRGTLELLNSYNKIFTTDSFCDIVSETQRLKVIKILGG